MVWHQLLGICAFNVHWPAPYGGVPGLPGNSEAVCGKRHDFKAELACWCRTGGVFVMELLSVAGYSGNWGLYEERSEYWIKRRIIISIWRRRKHGGGARCPEPPVSIPGTWLYGWG